MIPLPVRPIACTSMARCGRRRVGRQMQSVISSRELQQSHSNGRDCGRAQKSPSPDAGWASFVSNATAARAQPNGCPKAAWAQILSTFRVMQRHTQASNVSFAERREAITGMVGQSATIPVGKTTQHGPGSVGPQPYPPLAGMEGWAAECPRSHALFRDRRPIS